MREYADQFVWRLGIHDHPGLDEYVLPFGDERIHALIVDEIAPDRRGIESIGLGQGIFITLEQALSLGVSQQSNFLRCRLFGLQGEHRNTAGKKSYCARDLREGAAQVMVGSR